MIIGSWSKKEIGKRYMGLADPERGIHLGTPYLVLAESTYEKWLEELKAKNASWLGTISTESARKGYFYEVSVD